jgi:hypothetical protein
MLKQNLKKKQRLTNFITGLHPTETGKKETDMVNNTVRIGPNIRDIAGNG